MPKVLWLSEQMVVSLGGSNVGCCGFPIWQGQQTFFCTCMFRSCVSGGGAPTPAGISMLISWKRKFLHTPSVKLNVRGIWEWGIYGLNGWGMTWCVGHLWLAGWSIYDLMGGASMTCWVEHLWLNGLGIYDLNGWGSMSKWVTVLGICSK